MHRAQSDGSEGRLAPYAPHNRRFVPHDRVGGLNLLFCLLVLGTLLASSASSQYLEATIKLPDTLGPLNGPYHLAWDENPAHPRLYIGGEGDSCGVIVAEAITCKRLARISTGPVKALCFVPPEGKLYIASLNSDSVLVVDCATNLIISSLRAASVVPVMQYNAQNNRLYCGGDSMTVIDCAGDTVTRTIAVDASSFAHDSVTNRLFAGNDGPLGVIDCSKDSVTATIPEVNSASALCYNPTARKVYAVTTDTLFAILADGDSVVARLPFDSLGPALACDPQRNRIYCTHSHNDWGHWTSIACSADTIIKTTVTDLPVTFLACNASRDVIYASLRGYYDAVFMYDGTTGQQLTSVMVDGVPSGSGWSPGLDRLYCLPLVYPDPGYSCCLLSAIDGARDSITGIVPLTVKAEHIVVDSVHNRLYFTYGSTACGCVGVVDCSENVVTGYLYGGQSTGAMCYNPNNDRLSWNWSTAAWGGQGSSMMVYDCSTGTVADIVRTGGGVRASRLNLSLNKLYAYIRDTLGNYVIDVIDCSTDSVIKVVDTPYESFRELLLVPEDNTLWCLGAISVVVIDCVDDSVVAAVPDTSATSNDACVSPEDRRVYTGGNEIALSINMDRPGEMDTIHGRIPGAGQMRFLNIPGEHKAYWTVNNSAVNAHLFVIDTRTSTLVDSLWVNRPIAGMCLDHTGNYVYCAVPYDTLVMVIDARADSVVATIGLPPIMVAEKNPLVANRATSRIYLAQVDGYIHGDEIPVIRDSILTGVEDPALFSALRRFGPTIVSRGSSVRLSTTGELWDVSGRRAATLKMGMNDIQRLAPGIYYVREKPQVQGWKPQSARKIVIVE